MRQMSKHTSTMTQNKYGKMLQQIVNSKDIVKNSFTLQTS